MIDQKVKKLKRALLFFIDDDGQWKHQLHEEGCIGARELPEERDGSEECRCDGDDLVEQVLEALKD
jgi:hypothetical protein